MLAVKLSFRGEIRRFHVPNDVTLPAFKSLVSETLGVSGPLVVKCGSFSCNSDKDFIALLDEASAASPPLLRVTVDLVAAGIAEASVSRTTKPGCCPEEAASAVKLAEAAARVSRSKAAPSDSRLSRASNLRAAEYVYSGEALRAVALPFGAVGGGSIALAGDGGLRQWQINNRVNHAAAVPDSFFAVKTTDASGVTKAVALMSPACYNPSGFTPAPMITDADVPPCSIALLEALPSVAELQITAKFPVATVDYLSGEVPVTVSQEVLSPFIPLDSKDSGCPVIFFTFTVSNPTSGPLNVSLMQSQQNIAGWNGLDVITDEVSCDGYGGNTNNLATNAVTGVVTLDMCNPSLDATTDFNGHVAVSVLPTTDAVPHTVSSFAQYAAVTTLWDAFTSAEGLPGQGSAGPSPAGRTWNGALAANFTLAPGAQHAVTFMLTWHFPNKYVFWSQAGFGINDPHTDFWIGNNYATVWPTITDVINYAAGNMKTMASLTRAFRDCVYNSSLPWQLLDSACPRASVLRSPTCMWNGDGNFYAFEGCSEADGCCPLNCTHVWNYEMSLARLFPDLERTMRAVDLTQQIAPNAIIPSRTTVPLELRRQWSFWPQYTQIDPSSTAICVDGEIGTVIKLYRDVLNGAPSEWFGTMWPQAQAIMTRWMTTLDNGTGVVPGPQPNTYDCALYGVNSFVGGLYLCALRCAAEMATLAGNPTLAATYQARFQLGSSTLDSMCFMNGKWYTQVVDPKHPVNELSTGAFVDQLLGQWWAHWLGLGYILPQPHVATAVQTVFSANHRTSFDPAAQYPRKFFDQRDAGLYIGTWPDGPSPASPMLYTSEGAWSGLEYPMAGLALKEGLTSVWQTMLSDTRARQDGTRRSPWNEIECGDHYSRPMSGWVLIELASGQLWNALTQTLTFSPSPDCSPTAFQSVFVTNSAWGQFSQTCNAALTSGTVCLTIAYGTQTLSTLNLNIAAKTATVTVGAVNVPCTVTANGTAGVSLAFTSAVTVVAGSVLTVVLTD